jgi:hypothetical protein
VTVSFLELLEGGGVCGQRSDSEIGTTRACSGKVETGFPKSHAQTKGCDHDAIPPDRITI